MPLRDLAVHWDKGFWYRFGYWQRRAELRWARHTRDMHRERK
jgi:hypothetical protein